jgi:hypothetical protein
MIRQSLLALPAVLLLAACASRSTHIATCDGRRGQVVNVSGPYQPAAEAYARPFVFAMQIDCDGSPAVLTVERATGNLPLCEVRQPVEVVGLLVWNRSLFDSHYEINDPASATCR